MTGGLFKQPGAVAVNTTGAGGVAPGTFYVSDSRNNRIQRFSPAGVFERAWGADVELPAGGSDLEVCTVAADCKTGVASGGNGTPAGNGTFDAVNFGLTGVAVDPDTGKVFVVDLEGARVNVYDADGAFERSFGFDVVASGPGDTGTGYETCVQANGDVCKSGSGGSGVGQISTSGFSKASDIVITPDGVAPTGKVYLADTPNGRVNVYDLDGANPSDFGTGVFGFGGPGQLAIDDDILYASDPDVFSSSADPNAIKRYELDTSSFLSPIAAASLPGDGIPGGNGPTGLDIDADTGNLLVALDRAEGGVVEVGNPAGTPTFVDRHLTSVVPGGVAANPVTDEIIELIFGFFDNRVLILDDDGAPPASVMVGGATDVETDSATLNATVNAPAGELPTAYRIQYSRNGVDWTTAASGTVGAGDTENVSGVATGLSPNILYRVRVIVNRTLGNPDVVSPEATFLTDGTAPTIVSSTVDLLGPSSVRLSGYVNPNSSQTSYRFEWGTDPDSLTNRTPTPNGTLGAGPSSVLAAATLSGLAPNTTYHYRLVAISTEGNTNGPIKSFTTRPSPLPSRAPELVSPAVKSPNADVQDYIAGEMDYQIAPDGNNVFYTLAFGAPDATAGGELRYLARRGSAGWASEQMTPPLTVEAQPTAQGVWAGRYGYMAPDLSCGVLRSAQPLTPDASTTVVDHDGTNLFRRGSEGNYDVLTPEPINAATTLDLADSNAGYSIRGAADDCHNVVFMTPYRFAGVNGSGLYRSSDGVLSDIAVLPDGSSASNVGLGVEGLPAYDGATFRADVGVGRAISTDASHVYFTAVSNDGNDSGRRALYLHREGQPTIKVSGSKTATVNRRATFQIASRDGRKVAFMANYGLAPDSSTGPVANDCTAPAPQPCALYLYDVATDELVDVSATSDPANSNGATVGGVLGASDDLSRIYFTAQGQLVPGKGRTYAQNIASGAANQDSTFNVYVYTAGGGLSYVGLVARYNLTALFSRVGVDAPMKASQVTPDGGSLLFTSSADTVGYDSEGIPQAYLYSADNDELVCVSCRRDGEPPLASTMNLVPAQYADEFKSDALVQPVLFRNTDVYLTEQRFVSDDGSRVVFAMHDALTPDAVEGNQNIYLWDRGALTLLDSGMAPQAPIFYLVSFRNPTPHVVGMSPSGDDVFIRTPSKLVAGDTDGMKDLYDFRVGGGFPDAPGPEAPCDVLGDGCQGGGGAGPTGGDVASDEPAGDGNAVAGERQTLSVAALSAAARRRAARSGVLPVRVTVSGAGMVRLSARARIGRKARQVGSASKRAGKAGVVKVGVRLSAAARERLRSGRSLAVTVRVTQAGARARSMSVRLPGAGS